MKTKTIQKVSFLVVCLCLMVLLFSNVSYQKANQTFAYQNSNLSIASSNGTDGVLIFKPTTEELRISLPLLKRSSLKIVIQHSGEITDGLSYLKNELGTMRTVILSSGSTVTESFPCIIPEELAPSAVLMLSPSVDTQQLIEEGIYSCSYQTIAPTMILQNVAANSEALQDSVELYNLLSGDTIKSNGSPIKASRGNVSLLITSAAVTTDLHYSAESASAISGFIAANSSAQQISIQYILMNQGLSLILILALLLFFICCVEKSEHFVEGSGWQIVTSSVEKPWKFYLSRLVLLLSSICTALLIFIAIYFVNNSFGSLTGIFLSYFWAVGVITPVLYKLELIPGVKGIPKFIRQPLKLSLVARITLITMLLLASGYIMNYSGVSLLDFTHQNLFGLMLLIFLSALPYLGTSYEMAVVGDVTGFLPLRYGLICIPYLPLLVPIIFAVPLGWLPMTFALLRLLIVMILGGCLARITENLTSSPYIGATLGGIIVGVYLYGNLIFIK